jgi:hypothetical protein
MKHLNVILAGFSIAAGIHAATPEAAVALAPGASICVTPVQNLSEQAFGMNGYDDELVARMREIGYRAGTPGKLPTCDATAYTEIVHVGGRNRIRAEVEFRLVLAGEQAPRLSTTAAGKSPKPPKSRDAARREAILAAFTEQARKIHMAQRDGMALYASIQ